MIHTITTKLLTDLNYYECMSRAENPFGDGNASKRIVQIIAYYFGFIPDLPKEFNAK